MRWCYYRWNPLELIKIYCNIWYCVAKRLKLLGNSSDFRFFTLIRRHLLKKKKPCIHSTKCTRNAWKMDAISSMGCNTTGNVLCAQHIILIDESKCIFILVYFTWSIAFAKERIVLISTHFQAWNLNYYSR